MRDESAFRRKTEPRGFTARSLRDTLTAYAYISPAALIVGVFGIFPLFFTIYVSLFRWRLARGDFAALDNYAKLVRDAITAAYSKVLDGADMDATLAALQAQADRLYKDSTP